MPAAQPCPEAEALAPERASGRKQRMVQNACSGGGPEQPGALRGRNKQLARRVLQKLVAMPPPFAGFQAVLPPDPTVPPRHAMQFCSVALQEVQNLPPTPVQCRGRRRGTRDHGGSSTNRKGRAGCYARTSRLIWVCHAGTVPFGGPAGQLANPASQEGVHRTREAPPPRPKSAMVAATRAAMATAATAAATAAMAAARRMPTSGHAAREAPPRPFTGRRL